ncbi:MAG: peptidase, partial [Flintibacter sp.]
LMSDVYATLRAVVRDCRFDGDVTVKNECGGGVAGRCEAGAIVDCAARGTVETGGDYCGGIAGRTRGKVIRCAALTDLTGQSWLGGVAGLGQDITDCRTMVRADSAGEYQGAIAGQAEGTLTGNRYLMEDLAGLDGVDYAETAQGLDFDAFSQLEYIPADFLTFSYRFEVNGQTVAEIPFQYGDDLDTSLVPEAPKQGEEYGQWPQFPTQDLRRSMVLSVQFTTPTSTLADQDGVAQLLVEGTFSPDASLTVDQEELPDQKVEGYTSRSAWSYTVTGSQSDTITVRLRAEGVEKPAAAVYQDGRWQRVDSTLDGSYLVFQAPTHGQVLLLEEQQLPLLTVGLIGGGTIVLLLAGFFLHRYGRNRIRAEK